MSSMFRSLRAHNYRLWFLSGLISNVGSWVQSAAINWYVLTELTNGDATAVGVTLALQFAPQLLLLPLTGWLPDRFDRRTLILVIESLLLVQVLILGLVILTGNMTLPIMWILAGIFGVLSACDIPVRQVFVADLVDEKNLSNAIALNAASYNLGRMAGPALAGALLVAFGAGWAFIANAATYLALIAAVIAMRTSELRPRPVASRPPSVWGGIRYLKKRADLLFVSASIFLLGALTINIPLTSSFMIDDFGGDAVVFGAVNSIVAVGSLAGALVAARNRTAKLPTIIICSALMAVSTGLSAIAPTILLYSATLLVTGFAVILTLATANGYVQSTTPEIVRGRVLAAYMAVIMGASTVGSPLLGTLSDLFGPRWALGAGAITAAVVAGLGYVWLRTRYTDTRVE